MRSPYQILAFPFIKEGEDYSYAIFKRKDMGIWQGIAGGGEEGESPIDTVKREAYEETSITLDAEYIRLASVATIPAKNIYGEKWEKEFIMIPEISFGIEVFSKELVIGEEHSEYIWTDLQGSLEKLNYDSNKSAIWELDYRLKNMKSEKEIKDNISFIRDIIK